MRRALTLILGVALFGILAAVVVASQGADDPTGTTDESWTDTRSGALRTISRSPASIAEPNESNVPSIVTSTAVTAASASEVSTVRRGVRTTFRKDCRATLRPGSGTRPTTDSSGLERALRNDNQLQGSVQLEVRIGNDGKVSNTRIHGSLRDPEVSKCVQNLARNWVFHSPSGGSCAVFKAPYNFTPKH